MAIESVLRHRRRAGILLFLTSVMVGCGRQSTVPVAGMRNAPPEYRLVVHVLPNDGRLDVSGTVEIAAADTARSDLVLSLSERMALSQVEIVQPSTSAGLAEVARIPGSGTNRKVSIRPTRPFPPNQPVRLRFSCSGGGEASMMYYVGSEVALASAWGSDWYPVVAGDSEKGIADLTISVPPGWVVATGGARLSTREEEAGGTFRSRVSQRTYFTFIAGAFTVVRREGSVPVSAYLLSPREHIGPYLEGVEAIVDVLAQEFGPYPFDEFAMVEVPRDIANRAGFNAFGAAGLIVVNSRAFDAPDTKYLLEWLGHEVSHQWFPHAVALRTPPGLYMEEALAQYGGLKVVEAIAGSGAAKQSRMTGFEYDPIYSAKVYFESIGAGIDQPLARLEAGIEHRNLAYNKGALVFDMLSREIGRDEFRRTLGAIIERHRFQDITWPAFLDAIQGGTSRDLEWFFDQWFERTGAPDLKLTWVQESGNLRGTIMQVQPIYRAHLTVDVRGRDGQHRTHPVEIDGPRVDFVVPVAFPVESATLDPDFEILRWTPEFRDAAEAARQNEQGGE